jgi:lycopene cyclase CruA
MRGAGVTPASGAASHDRARALVREAGGSDLLERLDHLDRLRAHDAPRPAVTRPVRAPDAGTRVDVDVAIAGGGLWSLLAPVLAARGLTVAVLDRARAAQSHREWNASGPELEALTRAGIADVAAIERLVVARYARGVCRFAGGGTYAVRGVLDRAVDAGALLAHGRARAHAAGVRFLDGHAVVAHAAAPSAVAVRFVSSAGEGDLTARVLVDARGVSSPYATADLVCPTVGGVVAGLAAGQAPDEMDDATGEILATVDPVEDGRQHVWEAFPGRTGETTVYLFYYARRGDAVSLADLYARFFATLPRYKRGAARLVRPTFGLIPGWSRLCAPPRSPDARVVLVGDAAARHSPLTCCGFGATLRSLDRAAESIARVVRGVGAPPACVVDDARLHTVTGALAVVMASRSFRGNELNALLDAAFRSLEAMGEERYGALLRDELTPREALGFLRATAARHPDVWRQVLRVLGPFNAARWAAGFARAAWA